PDQAGQPIHDLVVAQVESRVRQGRTDGKRRVLAGTFARNLASIVRMAGALARMQIMARGHDCSDQRGLEAGWRIIIHRDARPRAFALQAAATSQGFPALSLAEPSAYFHAMTCSLNDA